MRYMKEISLMTKSEMLMYIYLISTNTNEIEITREIFENLGFSKSRFYEAKSKLMEKGILKQKIDSIYYFIPIKMEEI